MFWFLHPNHTLYTHDIYTTSFLDDFLRNVNMKFLSIRKNGWSWKFIRWGKVKQLKLYQMIYLTFISYILTINEKWIKYLHFTVQNTQLNKWWILCNFFRWRKTETWENGEITVEHTVLDHHERDELFCLLCQLIVRLFRLILKKMCVCRRQSPPISFLNIVSVF